MTIVFLLGLLGTLVACAVKAKIEVKAHKHRKATALAKKLFVHAKPEDLSREIASLLRRERKHFFKKGRK